MWLTVSHTEVPRRDILLEFGVFSKWGMGGRMSSTEIRRSGRMGDGWMEEHESYFVDMEGNGV